MIKGNLPYESIVVLTGAGISAESGIQTFRASDGLWENHRVEDVASPDGFLRDPALVHSFYNERRKKLLASSMKPNKGHEALANLEKEFPGKFLLVTQNIDNLHERAGNKNVIHMHGEILKSRCLGSEKLISTSDDVTLETRCTCCNPPKGLRPHVVWFGEMPLQMEEICDAIYDCDLFISVGTSGNVYPAAGFVQMALSAGAHTVELNLEPSTGMSLFKEKHYGPATRVVPRFVEGLLT